MPLGVINNTVRLEEHDPAWAEMARDFIHEIKGIMGDDIIDIKHVGSTAIYGVPAKPIIDVAVAVSDVTIADKYIDIFEKHGLHFLGELVESQRLFCKSTPGLDDRTHHLHFVRYDSHRWTDYQNMRDYCNFHPAVAKAYGDLKRKSAKTYANERKKYLESKDEFIVKTLKDAATWRASLTEPLSQQFKEEVRKIMHQNLMTMSRTAKGVLDLSASKDKNKSMAVTDAAKAKDFANANFGEAINKIIEGADRVFSDAQDLRDFIESIAALVNKNILKPDCLYRSFDAELKHYTNVSNMDKDVPWFYETLYEIMQADSCNPIEAATFTEYYMNMRIHMWADGCGKTAMICSAFMLIRFRCLPVKYTDRNEIYSYNTDHRVDCGSEEDKDCYQKFAQYYRTLC